MSRPTRKRDAKAALLDVGNAVRGLYLERPCPTCGHARAMLDGAYFRRMRLANGVALRETARRMGVSAAYLCDMENNKRCINEAMAERIRAAVLGRKRRA